MANEAFKKKAKDGDNDGFVQDGTPFERADSGKIAIHSNRGIYWQEVGRLIKGYNIVTPAAAEKWLTLKGIRVATPQEVAKEYGI